jgi:putative tricarboxylic transport membrane protein
MDFELMKHAVFTVFEPQIMIYLVSGLLLGFFIGAVPGFNDTNILAMLLPFSVYLGPLKAVIFMMAVFGGSQAAGPIPAILMNMPGTPSAAAVCLDGYAMTRKGLAKKALGASLSASTMGGIFGAVVCIFLGPLVGQYALSFGPAEMFMLAIFGLSAVATLAGKNPLKGLLSAVFGLLVATIGMETVMGYTRSSFGFMELYDGVPLIPVLLGLFGFAELFDMVNEESIVERTAKDSSSCTLWDGIRESMKHKLVMFRSAVIGVIIGIIPGTGAAIASWISYGQAKQMSGHPEEFGKGSPEAIVAVSACNNAVTGGALIPTITLGIPGSGTTLVIMTALMINNIQPGPSMFNEFAGDAYTIFFSLLVGNVIMFFLGLAAFRMFSKTASIPTKILVPIIALFSLTGSFAFRELSFDFSLTLLFGLFGWLLKRYGYSAPAFLLSLILGRLAETNFIWAIKLEGMKLFIRPIVLALLVLTVATLLAPLLLRMMRRGEKPAA